MPFWICEWSNCSIGGIECTPRGEGEAPQCICPAIPAGLAGLSGEPGWRRTWCIVKECSKRPSAAEYHSALGDYFPSCELLPPKKPRFRHVFVSLRSMYLRQTFGQQKSTLTSFVGDDGGLMGGLGPLAQNSDMTLAPALPAPAGCHLTPS